MSWLQIKIPVSPEHADKFEDLLLEAGCAAVTFQDAEDNPIFEPDLGTTPLWQSTVVTGLFSAEHDLETTLEYIRSELPNLLEVDQIAPSVSAEILEDKDWERAWMDMYHPMQFGQRLWVCPSWREVPDPNAVNLMLDPGLAFGTGTHPTTALCLEWLDSVQFDGLNVIDYGCGSGILGIAALLLGATHVTAVDIDHQALTATRDNLQRNHLDNSLLTAYLPEQVPEIKADLLIANILAGPLIQLEPTFAKHLKTGGQLLLSGLLDTQAQEIRNAYEGHFDIKEIKSKDNWIRITATRL
ncbi:MAG: 50S ribosomal protein L11 methyltransferase [Oceanospirillales bacterium]|nr:MAG: 50S ribosomal protein L11 methyltransferase [Oceanospirillales bacterium]